MKGQNYGKYRGTVFNNVDPLKMGRIQVKVPNVANMIPSTWAMPCLPFAGTQQGFYVIPSIGCGVWVEFEQGDPDYPVWTGCFYDNAAELPSLAVFTPPPLQAVVMQTAGQNALMISDAPGPGGGILLKSHTGAMISVSDAGIIINNGQGATIVMTGPSVTVNEGALVVT